MGLTMRRKTSIQDTAGRNLWTDSMGRTGVRCAQILLIVAVVVLAIFALLQVTLVVIPILLALILAAALRPVMRLLHRIGVSSMLSTVIAFLGILVVLAGVVTMIVFAVESQWQKLASSAASGLDKLQEFVLSGPIPISQQQIDSARSALVDFVTSTQFGAGAVTGLTVAGNLITGAILTAVILFFFLKDGERIWEFFLTPLRGERLAKARRSGERALQVLGGYVRGTATIALVDAVFIGLALVVLGVPLAVPLAVLIFIGAFIPIVGATATGILAALVALVTNGPVIALIVIGVVVLVNQLEGNFLQPVVMGNALKLHALVILLALAIGTVQAGIVGALLSVPITAVVWAIIKVWASDEPLPDPDHEVAHDGGNDGDRDDGDRVAGHGPTGQGGIDDQRNDSNSNDNGADPERDWSLRP